MDAEGVERDRIFRRFEDADYYYRERAVSRLRGEIETAVSSGDELAEVKAYERLYRLLSAGRDEPWRKGFFEDALLPMAEVFSQPKAVGYLHGLLGLTAHELGRADFGRYFLRAVEAGDDSVFSREDVLRACPEIILRWIGCRLRQGARDALVERREAVLERIVSGRADAGRFLLELAELLRPQHPQAADGYFRKCIRLGYGDVVRRPEFLVADYEGEYVAWFVGLCTVGVRAVEAKDRCLSGLWKTDSRAGSFSGSHRAYAERLHADGKAAEAAAEFVRCAEAGFDWAEQWICRHASERTVTDGLSEALVARWFETGEEESERAVVLGRYFDSGKGKSFRGKPKTYACVAWKRMSEGDLLGAVRACVEMDRAAGGSGRGVMDMRALRDFPKLEQTLSARLKAAPEVLVRDDVKTGGEDRDVDPAVANCRIRPEALTPTDVRVLGEYLGGGALDVSVFRSVGEPPLCCRYLLLERLAEAFSADAFGGLDRKTRQRQREDFSRQADRELDESFRQGNPMTIADWLIRNLMGDADERECPVGRVLARMVGEWHSDDCPLPLLLLAAYWSRKGRPDECLLALRLVVADDRALRPWTAARDGAELFRLAYETVVSRFRK